MTDKLINGDYQLNETHTALKQCDYTDELLQDAYILLSAKRGSFYPNKNFGSKIDTINSEPKDEYLRSYAQQALGELDGVYVKSAHFEGSTAVINLILNDKEGTVRIGIENDL